MGRPKKAEAVKDKPIPVAAVKIPAARWIYAANVKGIGNIGDVVSDHVIADKPLFAELKDNGLIRSE